VKRGISIRDGILSELAKHKGMRCWICSIDEQNLKADAQWKHGSAREAVMHVDHDHKTGKIRGLLCKRCNVGMGYFKDDPSILKKAVRYLEENT